MNNMRCKCKSSTFPAVPLHGIVSYNNKEPEYSLSYYQHCSSSHIPTVCTIFQFLSFSGHKRRNTVTQACSRDSPLTVLTLFRGSCDISHIPMIKLKCSKDQSSKNELKEKARKKKLPPQATEAPCDQILHQGKHDPGREI